MKPYEISEGGLLISDDKARLDRPLIHAFLSGRSYWAKAVPVEVVERSIEHSLCFGMYQAGRQIGFARAVTDFTTFAWLADVFIVEGRAEQRLRQETGRGHHGAPGLAGLAAVHARDAGRAQAL